MLHEDGVPLVLPRCDGPFWSEGSVSSERSADVLDATYVDDEAVVIVDGDPFAALEKLVRSLVPSTLSPRDMPWSSIGAQASQRLLSISVALVPG